MNKRAAALLVTPVLVVAALFYAAFREHVGSPRRTPSSDTVSAAPGSTHSPRTQAIADQPARPWSTGLDSARPRTATSTVPQGRAPAASSTVPTSPLPPAKQAIADQYARERAAGQHPTRPVLTRSTVALGQAFTVRPAESVLIGGTEYSLEFRKTDQFAGAPYAFATGDPSYPVPASEVPLDVVVKNTDGETYATLVVTSSVDACVAESGPAADKCLSDLATRTYDTTYCSRTGDRGAQDACLESVAAVSGSDAGPICQRVTSPRFYCQLFAPDTWTTLHDAAHGLSLDYPAGWLTASTSDDGTGAIFLLHDVPDVGGYGVHIATVLADTVFHLGNDQGDIRYDQSSNTWMFRDDRASAFTKSCQDVTRIGTQHAAAYDVSSGHDVRYVVILKQGPLLVEDIPDDEPPSPDVIALFLKVLDTITFDSTSSPITATCN